jgi:hypothetical protein
MRIMRVFMDESVFPLIEVDIFMGSLVPGGEISFNEVAADGDLVMIPLPARLAPHEEE